MKKLNMNITKSQAILIFGSVNELAAKIGVTPGAISQWPEQLGRSHKNQVFGAIYIHNLRRKYNAVMAETEGKSSND